MLELPEIQIKTLDEINREFLKYKATISSKSNSKYGRKQKQSLWLNVISNLFYIIFIISIIVSAVIFADSKDEKKSILGYRPYFIYTGSMEPDLPKGALIIVKLMEPHDIKLNDYVTYYMPGSKDYRTHAVIEIITNYEKTGIPGFRTKGINSPLPDEEIIPGKMIVGKVVYCLPKAGWILDWIYQRVFFVIGVFFLICTFLWVIGKSCGNKESKER